MTMHYKTSGVWKEIIDPQVKVSGVWKEIIEGWVNIAGVWKQFFSRGGLPEDLIAFSTDTDVTGWLKMDGAEASPMLIGKYPRVAASEGGIGGNVEHTHSLTANSGGTSAPYRSRTGGGSNINFAKTHTHPINHTHAATNHEPEYLKILPVTNGDLIKISMFLFYDGVSAPSGWSEVSTAVDKFFKGDATPETTPTGGVANHSHVFSGSTTAVVPAYDFLGDRDSTTTASSGKTNHSHSMNHTHSNGQNEPVWHGLIPVKPDEITSELPSGICAFFKGSAIPDGWSAFSVADGKWIKGKSSAGATGGSNTHGHSHSGSSGSGGNNNGNYIYQSGSYVPYPHTHTVNHTHGAISNEPPYQELMFLKKD